MVVPCTPLEILSASGKKPIPNVVFFYRVFAYGKFGQRTTQVQYAGVVVFHVVSPCNTLCCHPMNRSSRQRKADRECPHHYLWSQKLRWLRQCCKKHVRLLSYRLSRRFKGIDGCKSPFSDCSGKNLLDLIAGYKEHIKKLYGDEIDLVNGKIYNGFDPPHSKFFCCNLMSPHKFHYSLPIAVFNSNENHMGLHKWARVISDNLVHGVLSSFKGGQLTKKCLPCG